jgi:hypothetical protein
METHPILLLPPPLRQAGYIRSFARRQISKATTRCRDRKLGAHPSPPPNVVYDRSWRANMNMRRMCSLRARASAVVLSPSPAARYVFRKLITTGDAGTPPPSPAQERSRGWNRRWKRGRRRTPPLLSAWPPLAVTRVRVRASSFRLSLSRVTPAHSHVTFNFATGTINSSDRTELRTRSRRGRGFAAVPRRCLRRGSPLIGS